MSNGCPHYVASTASLCHDACAYLHSQNRHLFSADESGVVVRTTFVHEAPGLGRGFEFGLALGALFGREHVWSVAEDEHAPAQLCRVDTKVVQLAVRGAWLLVSSLTRVHVVEWQKPNQAPKQVRHESHVAAALINKQRWLRGGGACDHNAHALGSTWQKDILLSGRCHVSVRLRWIGIMQVGKALRQGEYGVCFDPRVPHGGQLLASRPGKRIWVAETGSAEVKATLKYSLFHVLHLSLLLSLSLSLSFSLSLFLSLSLTHSLSLSLSLCQRISSFGCSLGSLFYLPHIFFSHLFLSVAFE
jgi:hypothetical protein